MPHRLKVKHTIIKRLEEIIEKKIFATSRLVKDFLDMTPEIQSKKRKELVN